MSRKILPLQITLLIFIKLKWLKTVLRSVTVIQGHPPIQINICRTRGLWKDPNTSSDKKKTKIYSE